MPMNGWYPAIVTVAATSEPVSLAEARSQCRIDSVDTTYDADLTQMIAAARAYCERRCNSRFAEQTIEAYCNDFGDLARLPESPVGAVSSITYVDTDGTEQTVSTDVYEERFEGLDAAIVLKYGQVWPSRRTGSRIKLTATVGYETAPDDVKQAMLLLVNDMFERRTLEPVPAWSAVDTLLCNHIRGM